MSAAKSRNTRPTIGLIGHGFGGVGHGIWLGVADAARENDVNLLCFEGSSMPPSGPVFEAQRYIVYELANAETVDGLVIWSAGSFSRLAPQELESFCERYRPRPLVSIGAAPGVPTLMADNRHGMYEVVKHLIEHHSYRRIAYIHVPDRAEGIERYQGYVDALAEHGIPLDSGLVAGGEGSFGKDTGRRRIALLLDERKLRPSTDFEVVVAPSDATAIGAMEALRARGVQVPSDVALAGFDDARESAVVTPSLTTARQPFRELGWRAVEMMLALWKGEDVPAEVFVPTELVVRESCGCMSPTVTRAAVALAHGEVMPIREMLAARRQKVVADMTQAFVAHSSGVDSTKATERMGQLLDAFVDDVGDGGDGTFIRMLHQMVTASDDSAVWHDVISTMRGLALPHLEDESRNRAENLWQQARVLIGEAVQRSQVRDALEEEREFQALQELGQALITNFDVEGLVNVLAEGLPGLGIPSGYLASYENPQPYEYPQPAPEWSLLELAYTDGLRSNTSAESKRIELSSKKRRFPTLQLLADGVWPQERRYAMMVEPLHFQEQQIGFAVFEMGPRRAAVYQALRGHISSALQGAMLVAQAERRALQLQTSAEVSRSAGSVLSLDVLIQQVVDLIRERFGLYYVGLFLVEPSGRWGELRAGTGEAGRQMVAQEHKLAVGGTSMVGVCLADGQARIAQDVGEEAVRFDNPLLPDTHSEMALPLVSRDKVIGGVTIQSAQKAAFDADDIVALQTMADQLANAIANARLYEQVQQAYAEVEQQVAERTAELKREQEESARLQQEVIEAQQRAIQELSMPVIPVLEGVIVMPLIGSIDTTRARGVTRSLLAGIREHKAKVVILDITGVPIVDSGVAAYLNKTVQAARLKGARTIVTGISEAVAETIVDLGIDWSGIETLRDLRTGLRVALARG